MTIQAQRPTSPSGSPRGGHATHGMQPGGHPTHTDAYAFLDHRTRSRTVSLGTAPPGRYLSIEHGDEVRLIPLDRPITRIGRGLSADVRIEDSHVSRRHAIIVVDANGGPDGTRVLDDRSHNGTFVNGRAVTISSSLFDGDVVRLGSVAMRFVEVEPAVKPAVKTAPVLRRFPLPVRAPGALAAGR